MSSNDHTIDVKVRADTTGLSKGLSDAGKDLDKAKDGFSKYGEATGAAGKATQGFVEKNKAHMESVGKDAMIMGGAIIAGIGLAVHAYSEFASRMAQVQSLSHASAAEMDVMTSSALSMGTAYGLSANDVADAEIELVKAGVSVKEMMGGALPGALALAAAGQIDVGQATEIATIALTQFNLKGKDVPHVADLLAAGADKALGGVKELGDALKQGGLVAAQFGFTIDDTVGTLSAFANAGMLGSDAGTSLKTMLLQLASPSKQQANMMAEMGINAYDVQGKFIGVTALAGQLHDKLGPLADAQRNAALGTIFGSDAMRAASVLMKEGSDGIQKWIKDVNDQGFAAVQAAGKMNSLNGDFKKLQAAFETGLIKMGSTADGALRPLVQGITNVITGFSNLDPVAQTTIMTFAGITGGGLLLGGMLLTTIPKVYESVQAFKALEKASPLLTDGIKGVGKAAMVAAGLIAALQVAQAIGKNFETAAKSTDEWAQSLLALNKTGAQASDVLGKDMFKSSNGRQFVQDLNGIGDAIKQVVRVDDIDRVNDFGNALLGVVGLHRDTQLDKTRESVKGIDSAMANFVNSGSTEIASTNFQKMADEAGKQGIKTEEVAKVMPQYMDSLRKLASDMKVPLDQQELLNWALGQVPQKMLDAQNSTEGQAKAAEIAAKQTEAQQKALDDLGVSAGGVVLNLDKFTTALVNAGLLTLSSRDATAKFEEGLDALKGKIHDIMATEQAHGGVLNQNRTDLDLTSEAGRAANAVLDDMAHRGISAAQAMAKNGESQEAVQGQLGKTYDAAVKTFEGFGLSEQAANDLTREILHIPPGVDVKSWMSDQAKQMAEQTTGAINGIPKEVVINEYYNKYIKSVEQRATLPDLNGDASGTGRPGMATGGAVESAPGPKGIDSKYFKLAKGEHVLTDSDVDAMGGQDAVYAFRNQLHNGGVRPSYGTPAPAAPAGIGGFGAPGQVMGDIYVQNPFTGEYLLAQVDGRVGAGLDGVARQIGGMRR